MTKWMLALLTLLVLCISGCASSGGSSNVAADSGLPEIAAYEDEAFDALPDVVPAQLAEMAEAL